MTKIIRWQPADQTLSLRQAMDRLFEDSWVGSRTWGNLPGAWTEPSLDIYETTDSVVVQAAVPGMKSEEVDITVQGGYLAISGQTSQEKETQEKNYLRRETRSGAFSRTVELPGGLQNDKAEATFENGVLTITFPKAEQVKAKKIQVKAAESNGTTKQVSNN